MPVLAVRVVDELREIIIEGRAARQMAGGGEDGGLGGDGGDGGDGKGKHGQKRRLLE